MNPEAINPADRPSPTPHQHFLDTQETLRACTENFILPSPPSRKRHIAFTSSSASAQRCGGNVNAKGGVGTITLGYGRQLGSLVKNNFSRENLTSNVDNEKQDDKAAAKQLRRADDQEDDVIVIDSDTEDDVVVIDDDDNDEDDDDDEVEDGAEQQLNVNVVGEEVEGEEDKSKSQIIDDDDANITAMATAADAPAQEEQGEPQHQEEEENAPPPPVNPASPFVSPWLLHAKGLHQEQKQQQQRQDHSYGESVSMPHLLQNVFELDSFEDLSSCVARCLQGNPNAVSKVTVASAMATCLVGRLRKRAAAIHNKNRQQLQPQTQQKQWQQSKGKEPAETTVVVKKEVAKKKKKNTKPTVSWPGLKKVKERMMKMTSLVKKKYDGHYKGFKGFKKAAKK